MSDERKVTIISVMEQIINVMCDKYCKYPEEYVDKCGDPDIAHEIMLEEQCVNCPLCLL